MLSYAGAGGSGGGLEGGKGHSGMKKSGRHIGRVPGGGAGSRLIGPLNILVSLSSCVSEGLSAKDAC